jgi:hypothetical protein
MEATESTMTVSVDEAAARLTKRDRKRLIKMYLADEIRFVLVNGQHRVPVSEVERIQAERDRQARIKEDIRKAREAAAEMLKQPAAVIEEATLKPVAEPAADEPLSECAMPDQPEPLIPHGWISLREAAGLLDRSEENIRFLIRSQRLTVRQGQEQDWVSRDSVYRFKESLG